MKILSLIPIIIPCIMFAIFVINLILTNYHLRKTLKLMSTDLMTQKRLLDFLATGICNPIIKNMFFYLRNLSYDEYPKDKKGFVDVYKKFYNENYERSYKLLVEQISQANDLDEKAFLQSKLEKFKEIKNLVDTYSEESSPEYVQLLTKEIQKAMNEFYQSEEF